MLQKIWNGDNGRYFSDESSCRCWRKSDILPVAWNADINNNVGSATLAHRKKVMSDDICNELCKLMSQVKAKAHPLNDTFIVTAVFHSSFVVDPTFSTKDMEDMVSTWVNIEDDRDIVDAIVDEQLENIDDVSEINIDVYDDDCEEVYISLKDQKYTHLDTMEAMDVMRYYMTENAFPL